MEVFGDLTMKSSGPSFLFSLPLRLAFQPVWSQRDLQLATAQIYMCCAFSLPPSQYRTPSIALGAFEPIVKGAPFQRTKPQ